MVNLYNFIVCLVIIFYFIFKNDSIQLLTLLSILSFLIIIYRQKLLSLFILNIKPEIRSLIELTPIFIFLLIIFLILGDNYIYTSQDSLSMWGQHVRWIYINNSLWDNTSELIFKNNIPGVPIYQYISTLIFGFSEKNINLSLHFLSLLSLARVAKYFSTNNYDYLIIAPLIFISLPLLGYSFTDIMVDGFLASTITLYTVVVYLFLNQKEKFYNLIPVSIFLIMIKPISIWYLIFIPFFLIFWHVMFVKSDEKQILKNKTFHTILCLLPALYIWSDWNFYVEIIGGQREPIIPFTNFLSFDFNEKFLKVLNGFHVWALKGNFLLLKVIELPFYTTYGLLSFIIILMLYKNKSAKVTIFAFFLLNLFVLFNLITFLLLITFYFGNYEAQNVASIGRYFGTIFVTLITISIIMIYRFFLRINVISYYKINLISLFSIWLSCVFVLIFSQNYFLKLGHSKDIVEEFKNLKLNLNKLKNKKNVKIYFISQGSFGHDASAFFYILSSFTKSHWCWSFTNKNISGRLMHWDCKGSIFSELDGLNMSLVNYTHVYLYKIDNVFTNEQQSYFKEGIVEEKKLYSISVKNNSTELYLSPIN